MASDWEKILRRLVEIEERLTKLEKLQKQDADEAVGVCADLTSRVEEVEGIVEEMDTLVEYHAMLFTKYQVADLLLGRGSAASSSSE